MAKKPKRSTLVNKAEKLWKEIVRIRAGHRCEICGDKEKQLHPHHIEGKRSTYMKLYLANGILLCCSCHKLGEAAAHADFLSGQMKFHKKIIAFKGQSELNRLYHLRLKPPNIKDAELIEQVLQYEALRDRLKERWGS